MRRCRRRPAPRRDRSRSPRDRRIAHRPSHDARRRRGRRTRAARPQAGRAAELGYLELPVWSYVAAARFTELDATARFDVVAAPAQRAEALHLRPRADTALVLWLDDRGRKPLGPRTPADDAQDALELAVIARADLLIASSQAALETMAESLVTGCGRPRRCLGSAPGRSSPTTAARSRLGAPGPRSTAPSATRWSRSPTSSWSIPNC